MFVAVSVLKVPETSGAELEARFKARSKRVDSHDGFLRLRLLKRKGDPTEYSFVTEWTTQDAFKAYMKSHDFGDAHAKVPPELDAVIQLVGLTVFDTVVDSATGD